MKLGKNRHLLCIVPSRPTILILQPPLLSISYATLTQKLVVQISLPPSYFAAKIKSQIQSDARMEIEIFALNLQISIVIIQI